MIIEIALGIVLAVLILAFLPEILALGFFAALIAIGLAVVAAVLYWGFSLQAQDRIAVFCVALLIGFFVLRERHPDAFRVSPKLKRIFQIFGPTLNALISVSLWVAGAVYFYWVLFFALRGK